LKNAIKYLYRRYGDNRCHFDMLSFNVNIQGFRVQGLMKER